MSARRSTAATHRRGRDAGRVLCVAAVLAGLLVGAIWAAGSTYAWWNDSLTVDLGVIRTGSLEVAVGPDQATHTYDYNAGIDAAVTRMTITNTGGGRIDAITVDGSEHQGLNGVEVATWHVDDDGHCSVRGDVDFVPWNQWVSATTLRGDRLPAGASASYCLQTRTAVPASPSEHRLSSTVVLTGRTGGWTASAGPVTIFHRWEAMEPVPEITIRTSDCFQWLQSGSSTIYAAWLHAPDDDVSDAIAVFSSPELGTVTLSNQDVPGMIYGGPGDPQGHIHLVMSTVLSALATEPARRTAYEFTLEIVRVDDGGTTTVLSRTPPFWVGWDEAPNVHGHVSICEPEGWGPDPWSP